MDAAIRGGTSMAKKDIEGMTTLLIDAEMKMFQGLRTPVIFLQNVVVDLLLGLGFKDAFRIFADHVKEPLRRRARLHHDEHAGAARCPGRAGDREPDRLLQHQQDRFSHVWRAAGLRNRAARAAGSAPSRCPSTRRERSRRARRSSGSAPSPTSQSIVFGASSARNIMHTRDLVAEHWQPEPQRHSSRSLA